jgi:hypothetical protein
LLSLRIKKAQIPDRVYDMHTSAGRKKGRGLEHFLNEGASVRKERFQNDWEERGMAFALGDEISEEEKERRRLEKDIIP